MMKMIFIFLFTSFFLLANNPNEVNNINFTILAARAKKSFHLLDELGKQIKIRVNRDSNNLIFLYEVYKMENITFPEIIHLINAGALVMKDDTFLELKIGDQYGLPFYGGGSQAENETDPFPGLEEFDNQLVENMRQQLYFLNLVEDLFFITPIENVSLLTLEEQWQFRHALVRSVIQVDHLTAGLFVDYQLNKNVPSFNGVGINPFSIGLQGGYTVNDQRFAWSVGLAYQNVSIGGRTNIDLEKTSFDNSMPLHNLSIGGNTGGWSNAFMLGIGAEALLDSGAIIGAAVNIMYIRNHFFSYKGKVAADHPMSSIRNKHKIELTDTRQFNARAVANVSLMMEDIPLSFSVKIGVRLGQVKKYITHVTHELADKIFSQRKIPQILSDIDFRKKFISHPSLDNPESFSPGDEFFFEIDTTLTASFVLGIEAYTNVTGARLGIGQNAKGIYRIKVKKYEHDIIEVTVSPQKIYEMSEFASLFQVFNQSFGQGFSIAKSQSFIFDLKNQLARKFYFDFVQEGRLPLGKKIKFLEGKKTSNDILSHMESINKYYQHMGIRMTYLEQIFISTKKIRTAIDMPIISLLLKTVLPDKISSRWGGLSNQHFRGKSTAYFSNGNLAQKNTIVQHKSEHGEMISGKSSFTFMTAIKKISSKRSQLHFNVFDRITAQYYLEDTLITGTEINYYVKKINNFFDLHLDVPEKLGKHKPLSLIIQRDFSRGDIKKIISFEGSQRLDEAIKMANHSVKKTPSQDPLKIINLSLPLNKITQKIQRSYIKKFIPITKSLFYHLRDKLKEEKITENQAILLQNFLELFGHRALSFLHHLLDGSPLNLKLIYQSPYLKIRDNVSSFILKYTDEKGNLLINKKNAKKFFYQLAKLKKKIEDMLIDLAKDPFLIHRESHFIKTMGDDFYERLIRSKSRGSKEDVAQAIYHIRKSLLSATNFQENNIPLFHRLKLYKKAFKKKHTKKLEGHLPLTNPKKVTKNSLHPKHLLPHNLPHPSIHRLDLLDPEQYAEIYFTRKKRENLPREERRNIPSLPSISRKKIIKKIDDKISFLEKSKELQFIDNEYTQKRIRELKKLKEKLSLFQ